MPDAAVAARSSEIDQQRYDATGRCRRRRRRVCRPLSPASPAQGRLLGGGDRGGRRRRRHLVLEPLSRRTLRHPDHRLQLHVRSRTRERVDTGRRNTQRNRKSCAISASSPIDMTSVATSASAPRSRRRIGMTRVSAGNSSPTTVRAYPAAITSWPPAVSPRQSRRRSTASRISRARSISPDAGRMMASISQASASP